MDFKIEGLVRSPIISGLVAVLVSLGACSAVEVSPSSPVATSTLPPPGATTTDAAPSESPTTTTAPEPTTTTTVPLALGEELVFNGDFSSGEQSPEGWQIIAESDGQIVDYVSGEDGRHLSFFGLTDPEAQWPEATLLRPFAVEPHTDYLIEVEARASTGGRLFLALVFLDDDGDRILLRGPGAPEVSSSDWQPLRAVVESPVRAASAYLIVRLAISPELIDSDTSSVDVNRVSIREVVGS